MTALRVARGIVVGIDIGGVIALRLAATRPERVEKLVLVNTPTFDELPARDITQMQRSTAKFAFRTTRGVLGAAPLIEGVLKGSVADPETHMPVKLIARYLAPFAGRDGVNHLLTLASSITAEDVEDIELKTIHVPALVIWGEEDQWADAKTADALVNSLPDGRLVRLPGIGRLVPEESPERMNALLLEFMKRRAVA
jgi:pimeloyl-ACP methyl ester carboxylesterase